MESIDITDTAQKMMCYIDKHNVNIVNIIDYVAYICNTFFLNLSYSPYPEFSLFSMIKDIDSQKQFCPRLNMLIGYVSIYTLCTTCKAERMLETPSFQKLNFLIDFY